MERILITGATGLIGSHVTEHFISRGIDVVCMVRKKSDTSFLESLNVGTVFGDITDPASLKEVLSRGFSFVIHTAAKVGDWGNYNDFYDSNVNGTLNVLKAAKENGIKDVIITGSISVYGEESSAVVKDENCEFHSHYKYFLDVIFPSGMNYYRDTKAEANTKAIQYAKENGLNLTILDPAWVYGERELHSGFYDYLKTVKSGSPVVPGSRQNKFHSIYARDLAEIYFLAFKKKLKGVNRYLAVSPEAEYQYKILDLMCAKAGLRIPARIPKPLIYAPALAVELFYSALNLKSAPVISRARVNIFYDNIEYSSEKVMRELGFVPRYSLEESVENTVNWYKENNYL